MKDGAKYEYKTVNITLEPHGPDYPFRKPTIQSAANRWARMGWRTVGVILSRGPGYADAILVEREVTDGEDIEEDDDGEERELVSH